MVGAIDEQGRRVVTSRPIIRTGQIRSEEIVDQTLTRTLTVS